MPIWSAASRRPDYDAAWCVCEGAFSLLEDDEQNLAILRAVFGALKPGGRFFLTALSLVRLLAEGVSMDLDTGFESWLEAPPALPDKIQRGHNRAYLYPELCELLREVGFEVDATTKNFCFGRAVLRREDMELNLLARKPRAGSIT